MDSSSSQSVSASEKYSHRLADIVGTAIALLTLALPITAIAQFSDNSIQSSVQPISYELRTTGD